jgi:hypothetical protein
MPEPLPNSGSKVLAELDTLGAEALRTFRRALHKNRGKISLAFAVFLIALISAIGPDNTLRQAILQAVQTLFGIPV